MFAAMSVRRDGAFLENETREDARSALMSARRRTRGNDEYPGYDDSLELTDEETVVFEQRPERYHYELPAAAAPFAASHIPGRHTLARSCSP